MKSYPRDLEVRLDRDVVFLRLDPERLCRHRHTWNSDRHSNADYELHIVLQGVCQVDVEDGHYSLLERQAILIAPGQYHQARALPGPFERFSLSFSLPDGPLADCVRQQLPSRRVFSITPEIERLCRTLLAEYTFKELFWRDLQAALLSELTLRTFRLLHLSGGLQPIQSKGRERLRTDLIDDYFERHFADRAGLSDLADLLHLSTRQVDRVLRDSYGMGFQAKLLSARMDHAAWLLRTTDRHTAEIAGAVGYVSEAAFYQAFRSHFHVTPRQYRRQFLAQPRE